MEEPKKNAPHIKAVEGIKAEIETVINNVSGKYNNREMSLVITKLQEAKMLADQYIEVLKQS